MSRQAGFTLIEVLAATAVFALISAISVSLLIGALRTEEQGEAAMAELSDMQRINALLRDDIGQLAARAVRMADGPVDPRVFAANIDGTEIFGAPIEGPRQIMVLTRTGWANPGWLQPRSSLQRVAWELDEDRLYRTVWPYPDAAHDTEPMRQLLAEGLASVELDMLQGGVWVNVGQISAGGESAATPPQAVRLRYQLTGLGQIEHVALSPSAVAG